jgi:hypothetical protein
MTERFDPPRHRHQPQGAVECGNVERDFRLAIRPNRDDAGIERHRLLLGRSPLHGERHGLAFIAAAGADAAKRAERSVD